MAKRMSDSFRIGTPTPLDKVDNRDYDDYDKIFVFGSNEAGVHGAGAAHFAYVNRGAEMGLGFGIAGKSFAIPTKDWDIVKLPNNVVEFYVRRFVAFAKTTSDIFEVTRIGCGLAGFTDEEIAPMFRGAPPNCELPTGWEQLIHNAWYRYNFGGSSPEAGWTLPESWRPIYEEWANRTL